MVLSSLASQSSKELKEEGNSSCSSSSSPLPPPKSSPTLSSFPNSFTSWLFLLLFSPPNPHSSKDTTSVIRPKDTPQHPYNQSDPHQKTYTPNCDNWAQKQHNMANGKSHSPSNGKTRRRASRQNHQHQYPPSTPSKQEQQQQQHPQTLQQHQQPKQKHHHHHQATQSHHHPSKWNNMNETSTHRPKDINSLSNNNRKRRRGMMRLNRPSNRHLSTFAKSKQSSDSIQYRWLVSILIFFMAITVYWNSLDGEFVHDDIVSIVRNPDVAASSWAFWSNDYWGMPMSSHRSHKSYRPLTVLSFRLDYFIGNGLNPRVFHLTNVFLHGAVSVLVYLVCWKVLDMCYFSCFTASAIFAVHPIHSEAVAGITGRSDSLACLIMLSSLLVYLRAIKYDRKQAHNLVQDRKNSSWNFNFSLFASGLLGCLAMLAKETGITVIGIIIFYDIYLHLNIIKGWFSKKGIHSSQNPLRWRITLLVSLIVVGISVRMGLMNGSFPRFAKQDNPAAYSKSILTRFLTFLYLPAFNFWLLLCPLRLSYDWQMGSIPLIETIWDIRNIWTLCFFASLLFLAYYATYKAKKHGSRIIVCLALLFLSLPFLPASNLLFPVGFVVAERILYTPSIGLCILTGHGIKCLKRKFFKHQNIIHLFLCLMLMSLSYRTWDRNFVWKSRATLFESGIKENSGNAKVHYNYANLQKDLGNIELAVEHYQAAIRLWPDYASAHNNLGALAQDFNYAEDAFLKAIQANPQHNGAHFNLGVIYMRSEKYEEALEHLEECLKIDPSHVEALQYLGACYNVLNKTNQAETVFHKLISSDLPPSKLHTNFGVFLQQLGLASEALNHYLLALEKASWDTTALVEAAKLAFQLGSQQLFHQLSGRLLDVKFDTDVAYMVADDHLKHGNLVDAEPILHRLAEESDSFYKIHYAQLLIQLLKWTEAEWILRSIPQSDPNHQNSILLLVQVYENTNKTTDAIHILNYAVDYFCPQEPNLCAQFYSQLGNLMHTTGSVLSAANYYDQAIKLNPESVQAHTNIGAIYHLMSNYQQAQFHYSAALKIEPTNEIVKSNIKKLERAKFLSYYNGQAPEFNFATRNNKELLLRQH